MMTTAETVRFSRGLTSFKTAAKTFSAKEYSDLCETCDDIYEYIPDDRPVKLYFDIDIKGDADTYDGELSMITRLLEIAKMGISKWAVEMCNVEPRFCVSNSSSPRFNDWAHKKEVWKVSLHIVVDNIIGFKSTQAKLVKDMNKFLSAYRDYNDDVFGDVGDELRGVLNLYGQKHLFDESPYDRDRKIRAVGSSKPNENRPLVLMEGTFEQSVISAFIPEDAYVLPREETEEVAAANGGVVKLGGVVINAPKLAPTSLAEYDYKKVEEFIECGLFDDKAREYKTWINMAFALYNAFGVVDGWVLFEAFSQRCPEKYDEYNNRQQWDRIAAAPQPENVLTVASIMKWARDANKDEYNRIYDKYRKQRARETQKEEKEKSEKDDPTYYKNVFARICPEFEKKHLKIVDRGIYIKEFADHVILLSPEKLKAAYSHMECGFNKKGVPQKFIDVWMNYNDNIRRADNMDIFPDPSKNIHNHYNLWRPFAIDLFDGEYTPNDAGMKALLDHILVLCDYEKHVYDYILLWIAHMLQHPAKKSIVPTFISLQGSGKGTLMKLLARLIGASRVLETTNPSRDVWGNFNGLMPEKFLVNLNELSRKETIESEGKIKALITDPRLTINPKGVGQYEINSYHRFIITTNNEHPVNTSHDDRRNLIIRCSDDKKGDAAYFIKMNEYLDDDNVIRTIGAFFKSLKVEENFNVYPMPHTKYQDDLKEASRPIHELWLEGFVMTHQNERAVLKFPSEVWDDFNQWCGQNGFMTDGMNSTKLGIRLNNLFKPKERNKYIETEQNGAHKKTFRIKALLQYFENQK